MKKYKNMILGFLTLIVMAIVAAQLHVEGVSLAFALAVYAQPCSKTAGGNNLLAITEVSNITGITVTTGEVSAITLGTGLTFKKIAVEQDTLQRTHAGVGSKNNIGYTHQIKYSLSNPDVDLETHANALADASPCGIAAIVLDGNNQAWLVGYNDEDYGNRPLRLLNDDFDSGLEPIGDGVQNNDFTLQCISRMRALPLDSTLSEAIADGTSALITWSAA